ncbi:hypothetical protein CCE28_02385 [Anaeromicrobium sediminis]|uniref:Uncharacterized protein n=2 Tax=Anaeromicrobium sediminis TaxID=1478221 RepID=A0A267MNX6_9FIRM|nr:hypothetical protein CCE28_02385 [Anaeromicrobium sediminis]
MYISLLFLKKLCVTGLTLFLIRFIDNKFNVSSKLFAKLESMFVVKAVELIIVISSLSFVSAHTNIDNTIIESMVMGASISIYLKQVTHTK